MVKTRYKLSRELSMAIMLLATPILILALGVLFIESRHLIHQEVINCTQSTLNTTLLRIEKYMNTVETAANANAWMLEQNFRPDSLKSVSNHIVQRNPSVVSSSVFAVPDLLQGRTYSLYTVREDNTVTTYEEPEYSYLDMACYTRPVTTGDACWLDPFIDNTESKVNPHAAVATYSRPLRQDDGRIIGVLTTDLSFSHMAKMLDDVEQPYPHAYFMLLGSDGRYLIHPDSTRLFHKTIFTDADPSRDRDIITLGHEMTAGKQGTMHIHFNGDLYHICYQPVAGTNWSMALVCPDSDAMKSYYHLGYLIIALLVIGLLIILVLSNRVVKQAIAPVKKLIETTQQIVDGQYYQTIPTTSDTGVIGQLQNSFAKMHQSLDERMGSLQQQYETLRQDNETLELAKRQAEDTVSRKNHAIHYMTQQLRMPLNVITGFADVLGENSADNQMMNEEELNNVQVLMKNNVVSLDRMLLMMSDATSTDATETLRSDKTDEVSCNKVAQQCISVALSHYPQASIQFETELQDTACILANHNHLAFILCELLYNAAKHSDGKHIVLRVTQTKDSVLFTLQDKGPGLPADLDLTYRPFTTEVAKSLGLPLVNRYTVVMGGTLTIDTDYHEGCRVTVSLPR
jgi:signal transduction histidine kinase